jgi:PTS system galactitol-specific IIA component
MELLRERIREDLIFFDIEGDTSIEVLENIAGVLQEKGVVKDTFAEALVARENEFPTGLPIGEINVAIPHTYPEHINEVAVTVCVLKEPVALKNMGDPTQDVMVSIVLCITMKKLDDNVKLLPELMGFFADESNLKGLVACKTPQDVIDLIAK